MAALPKFVVIKSASNETCLQLPSGNSRSPIFKELGDDSKGVKQEVVEASTGDGLVHIKCCDTGKYWTLSGTKDGINYYVTADSDKQVEDGASVACTLIKPSQKNIGGVTVFNFQIQRESIWHSLFLNSKGVLESGENAVVGDFIVADWEKLSRGGPRRGANTTGGDASIVLNIGRYGTYRPVRLGIWRLRYRYVPYRISRYTKKVKKFMTVTPDSRDVSPIRPETDTPIPLFKTMDARVEDTAIEDGIAIANKAAVGHGRVSIVNTSYGVGGSAGGDGISVADVDIAAGVGKLTVGKRVSNGGIKIGYPLAP